MPVFNFFHYSKAHGKTLNKTGPVVSVEVGIPAALKQFLGEKGLPIPPAVPGLALVDTGAFATAIDESIFSQLGCTMQTDMTLSRPDGTPITGWEEWTRPKRDYQWAPGRSAMELAKAWFPGDRLHPPPELMGLLLSHPRLQGLKLIRGIPEHVTRLPERGEGRNHDLWLLGRTQNESVTICLEAKADEPFGNDTVAEYRKAALHRIEQGESTRVPERIDALLGIIGKPPSNWESVRYQLLTAICGTVLQAKQDLSSLAVFVVHEFQTEKTTADNLRRNSEHYERFLTVIGVASPSNTDGHLHGPLAIHGMECFVGKTVRSMKAKK